MTNRSVMHNNDNTLLNSQRFKMEDNQNAINEQESSINSRSEPGSVSRRMENGVLSESMQRKLLERMANERDLERLSDTQSMLDII